MNALESASLVMIPSGYEDGTLGSLKPTDGSGDFTFSRGSNLTATRIGEDGYIKKGYENLLIQSNTFSSADWNSERLVSPIQTGFTGYDGSSDAWKLIPDAINNTHRISQLDSQTGVKTFSVYLKQAGYSKVRILGFQGNNNIWEFDLDAGVTIGNPSYAIEYKATNVGNDWWRLQLTTQEAHTAYYIFVLDDLGNTTFVGDGTSGILIQDAMLNQGLVAYPYIETTTAPVAGGILEDEPRIDFSDGCGHLLLEPSRTNLIPHSEYLGGWNSTPTYTNTNTLNPEGRSVNSFYTRIISQTINVDSNQTYSLSAYAKKDTWNWIYIRTAGFDTSEYTWFDLENGSVGTASAGHGTPTITPEGNGWYRCTIYFSSTTDLSGNAYLSGVPSNGSTTQGSNDQEAVFIDMIQCEQGSYPTSYIPTYGVSQTRLADNIDIPSSADLSIPSDSWTILWDISDDSVAAGSRWFDDSLQKIQLYPTSTSKSRVYWRGIGQYIASEGGSKIIARYDGTTATEFHDGINKGSASYSGQLPFDFNSALGVGDGKYFLNKIVIFPTALSDDECIALTTI